MFGKCGKKPCRSLAVEPVQNWSGFIPSETMIKNGTILDDQLNNWGINETYQSNNQALQAR
jgi:hypothetical protein